MKQVQILYHSNCMDGFGAAWAAWRKFGDTADYTPVYYGGPIPKFTPDCYVYILDFSYPRRTLLELNEHLVSGGGALLVLDHHKTAQADLEGLKFCEFDMNRSGAMMAWNYFHPENEAPRLIKYVQDRDLWRFVLSGSHAVSLWIYSFPMTFYNWNENSYILESDVESVIREGLAIKRYQAKLVFEMTRNAVIKNIGGYMVPVVNATVNFSEVGEELCKQHPDAPFAAYYLDRKDGKRQWGLRTNKDFDVSEIAKKYGGGGHPGAAGFVETITMPSGNSGT